MSERFELKRTDGGSFFGKAIVEVIPGGYMLISYDTNVCKIVDGAFIRLWDDWSATTLRHVNAFRIQHGFDSLNKWQWLALGVA